MSRTRIRGAGRAPVRRRRLETTRLEDRLAPATLLHSLFPNGGTQAGAQFGKSVATSSEYRVIGAAGAELPLAPYAGQAYVYDAATNKLIATLDNPTPEEGDMFGTSIAISGKYVVVGAINDDTGGAVAGAVYVYDLSSGNPTAPLFTLRNSAASTGEHFGFAVAVSGTHVVVGTPYGASYTGTAFVFDLDSSTPAIPIAKLNNPTPFAFDMFGSSVAISNQRIVIGAYDNAQAAIKTGRAYVYDLGSATPTIPVNTLNNPTPAVSDRFGYSVAISAHQVVVGAYADDTAANNSGSAYVYDLNSMTPDVPAIILTNPAPATAYDFGISVSISGNQIVIGADHNEPGAAGAGIAFAFDLGSITPTIPIATFSNPAPAANDFFGTAVAVSGNNVIVGAFRDDLGANDAGSASVYDLGSLTPTVPVGILSNPALTISDHFGRSVALSGSILVVGAPFDDSVETNAGSAYVYDLGSKNPTSPIAILGSPLPGASDLFGISVAVSGHFVVIGAPDDDVGALSAGSAYIYDLLSANVTVPIATLNNPTPAHGDQFGCSVAVSGSLVVVARFDDAGVSDSGSAYVYELNSATPTTPIATFSNPSTAKFDSFGSSVAVAGNIVVVGAYQDDTGATNAGSAYVYDLNSPSPATPVVILNNPIMSYSYFGNSVAVSGNTVVVGAPQDNTGATYAGSAYVYDLSSVTPNVPEATLNNPSPVDFDEFGYAVAISGSIVVVGAWSVDAGASNAGSAYVYDLEAMTPTSPIATLENPSSAKNDFFGNAVAVSGNTVVIAAYRDDTQNVDQGAVYVYTLAAPRVANVQVNSSAAQRSRVTSLAVTFDQPVSFSGSPSAAFGLKRQSDGATVALDAVVNGNTVTLSFTGGAVEFGSLADGRYTLTIDASQVSNSNGKLDGNGDGVAGGDYVLVGNPTNKLFRLFGDQDGDGDVDVGDYSAFRLAFGVASNLAFDGDGDGDVDLSDFSAFRVRFGVVV